jgi:hypothetical protein
VFLPIEAYSMLKRKTYILCFCLFCLAKIKSKRTFYSSYLQWDIPTKRNLQNLVCFEIALFFQYLYTAVFHRAM